MQKQKLLRATLTLSLILLYSCGQAPSTIEESCTGSACSEADINAPIGDGSLPENPLDQIEVDSPAIMAAYSFPAYNAFWGLKQRLYDKAKAYYNSNQASLGNTRYVTIVDMGLKSSIRRLFLFDLKNKTVARHLTSHGKNSDTDNDGYATSFSNTPESKKTSLGFYITLATYSGAHGYSLRLRGLSSTNSNAESRAIVMHPADYVQEENNKAGRSWGCPALDPSISRSVINKVKDGSLLLIDK